MLHKHTFKGKMNFLNLFTPATSVPTLIRFTYSDKYF